jgi:hypothetical protein
MSSRISSGASSSKELSSLASSGGEVAKGRQYHAGSVVSHLSHAIEEDKVGQEEKRAGDAESRTRLKARLFGEGALPVSQVEEKMLRFGKELILDIDRLVEPRSQSNSMVELASCEREGGVLAMRATVTVRASTKDVASFLHDFDSAYFTDSAEKDSMVRDRFLLDCEGEGEEGENEQNLRSHTTYVRYVRAKRAQRRGSIPLRLARAHFFADPASLVQVPYTRNQAIP